MKIVIEKELTLRDVGGESTPISLLRRVVIFGLLFTGKVSRSP